MNSRTYIKPVAEHHLDIGRFIFYPNIIVGEFNEGMHVTFENASSAVHLVTEFYGTENPFIYISNRINSYSQDVTGYHEYTELFSNLKGFAVVATSKRLRMLANLERFFINKPMRVFENLDKAMEWSEKLLVTKN